MTTPLERRARKAIICGGRTTRLDQIDFAWLDGLVSLFGISEVVSGGCSGVDQDAEAWAREMGIPVTRFNAAWGKHGNAAGPIRNQEMADYCAPGDCCVVFPGGKGTQSMKEIAQKRGLTILELHHYNEEPDETKA